MRTHDLEGMTGVTPARSAGIASATVSDRLSSNMVAELYACYSSADFYHFSNDFMPPDKWIFGKSVCAVKNMQITAANAGTFHFDFYIIRTGYFRLFTFGQRQNARLFD
jgi:hypothetical protein